MGLFSSTPEVDKRLARWILAEEGNFRRSTEKVLAKNQVGIPTLLEDGEDVQAITHEAWTNELLVVTNRRLLRMKRGKMHWAPIPLAEVAETEIGARDLGRGSVRYMLIVNTYTSKQYADSDHRHFDPAFFFSIDFDDLRDARAACTVIDMLVGRLR